MKHLYARQRLPQWTIEDVIESKYSYYFGLALAHELRPSQREEDYSSVRYERKKTMLQEGMFDPIIVDSNLNIICGHHRHQVIIGENPDMEIPIICLEGVTIDQVVLYHEAAQLHKDAQMDWLAEQEQTREWQKLYKDVADDVDEPFTNPHQRAEDEGSYIPEPDDADYYQHLTRAFK